MSRPAKTKQEMLAIIDKEIDRYRENFNSENTWLKRFSIWIRLENGRERERWRQEIQDWEFLRQLVEKVDKAGELVKSLLEDQREEVLSYLRFILVKANRDQQGLLFHSKMKVMNYFAELLKEWVPSNWIRLETGQDRERWRQEIQDWEFLRQLVEKVDTAEELVKSLLEDQREEVLSYLRFILVKANGDQQILLFHSKMIVMNYFAELLKEWVPSKELVLSELDMAINRAKEHSRKSDEMFRLYADEIQKLQKLRDLVVTTDNIEELTALFGDSDAEGFKDLPSYVATKVRGETELDSVAFMIPLLLVQYYLVARYSQQI